MSQHRSGLMCVSVHVYGHMCDGKVDIFTEVF